MTRLLYTIEKVTRRIFPFGIRPVSISRCEWAVSRFVTLSPEGLTGCPLGCSQYTPGRFYDLSYRALQSPWAKADWHTASLTSHTCASASYR